MVSKSPDEDSSARPLLAYFFVPLADPLGLPDGYVHTIVRSEAYEEWVARHEHDERGTHFVASMRFWRIQNDWSSGSGVVDAIRRALPAIQVERPGGIEVEGTVVELVVGLESVDEHALSEAFDAGLQLLREFQRGYYLFRRRPIQLVTRQRMPPHVLYAVREGVGPDDPWPDDLNVLPLNLNIPWRDPDVSGDDLKKLEIAIDLQRAGRVFLSYADLQREAQEALDREGDTRDAVLKGAASAEVLLDDVLAHLIWEEGTRPEGAAAVFQDTTLVMRVKREYHQRLGGKGWDLQTASALRTWHNDLAELRHRVIHGGVEPTYAQARQALDALDALESAIVDRVISDTVRSKYPLTAATLLGREGLERRGLWTRRQEQLLSGGPSRLDWGATFWRWMDTMRRARLGWPERPEVTRSSLLAVVHPGGAVVWVLHDRRAAMAAVANPPSLPPRMEADVSGLIEQVRHSGPVDPTSIAIVKGQSELRDGAKWLPQYRLVPLAGVMVTGNDLDPPSP